MTYSVCRRFAVVMLALSALALAACAGQRTAIPGSGAPASEEQIREMISGYSFDVSPDNGQTYFAADGVTKSFMPFSEGHTICIGTWRLEGSYIYTSVRCSWMENGKINHGEVQDTKYRGHMTGFGGKNVDVIRIDGATRIWEATWERSSGRHKGFPREAEFDAVSKQLGL